MHPPKCKVYIQWMGNTVIIIIINHKLPVLFDTLAINCNERVAQVK